MVKGAHPSVADETHHEPRLDDPEGHRKRRARRPSDHGGHYMQSPRVFPDHRLITFRLSSWIQHPLLSSIVRLDHRTPKPRHDWSWGSLNSERDLPEGGLDAVVNREIDSPCRQVA